MPQFLIGFWCGVASATLVICLIYANKKKQVEDVRRRKTESAETEDDSGKGTQDGASELRVLLVDDSRLSRTVMRELLEKKKWKIFEAGSGTECLKLAKRYKFDLVFMDQNMPGMDGDETLQRMWIDGSVDATVQVVAVGSNIRKENEKEFCEKGYIACLGKPIQANRMEEILSRVLTERQDLQVLDGFSYETGLAYFDGNESAYRETLVLFAQLWEERRAQLQQFLGDGNMEEYAILIHAVKGDARTLGAGLLGELAYEQELQAKEGNAAAVASGMEQVIKVGDRTAEYFKRMFS